MSKILVTGAAGFIGMQVALQLLSEGHTIIGLDNINDYYDVNLKYNRLKELGIERDQILYDNLITGVEGFQFIQLDLVDSGNLYKLFAKENFDLIVHLAAQAGVRFSITNPRNYIESNMMGFYNILEACRHFDIQHLVYASSSSIYGLNQSVPFHEDHHSDHPVSLYAATKKSNEIIAHSYSHLYQIPMTGLRFFTVYGPWGRPDMAPYKFTKAILNGDTIQVYNNGEMYRDFTYIDDIVNGVCKTTFHIPQANPEYNFKTPTPAASSAPYRIFNIGNSKPVYLMDFIQAIEKAAGKKANMNMLPMQAGDVHTTYADTSLLKEHVGYQPTTDLQVGIQKFVDWFLRYYFQERLRSY